MTIALARILQRTQTTFVLVFALVFLAGAPLNPRPRVPAVFATEVRLLNPNQNAAAFDPPRVTLTDPVERAVQMIAGTDRTGDFHEDEITHAQVFVTARSQTPYGRIVIEASCSDEAASIRWLNRYPESLDLRPLGAVGMAKTMEFVEATRRRMVREQSELERQLRGQHSPRRERELRKRLEACRKDQSILADCTSDINRRHEEFLRTAPRWELVRAPYPVGTPPLPPGAMLAARLGVAALLALIVCLCVGSRTRPTPDREEQDAA